MNRRAISFGLLCAALGLPAAASAYSRVQGYVTDDANVLDQSAKDQITGILGGLRTHANAHVAVVTVTSLDGRTVDDYANVVFQTWKEAGGERDNAVLFLVAPVERQARLVTGFDMETALPDSRCDEIILRRVGPALQAGRATDAIYAGVTDVSAALGSKVHFTRIRNPRRGPAWARAPLFASTFGFLAGFLLAFAVFFGGPSAAVAAIFGNLWIALFCGKLGLIFMAAGYFLGSLASKATGEEPSGDDWLNRGWSRRGGFGGGSFGSGGGGGFGGGSSGGGGASGSW